VPQIVHYYCEQAQSALAAKPADVEAAHKALDAADHALTAIDAASSRGAMVRTAMLRARLALIEQDPKRERLYLESVMTDAPEYAGLVAEQVLANYRAANQAEAGLEVLQKQYARHASLDLFNVLFRELRVQQGSAPAWTFARGALRSHPSLLGLDRLLEAELANSEGSADHGPVPGADLTLLRSLIHKHTQRLDRYACRSCGFQARRFYWQCPGCNAWETYAPRRLEELE
jgi:lipopolysaccharide biosynthesis regulator YciM